MTLSARVPDLPALEALLAVAQAGSLNAASRQLGITQQAMSARISSAEARTGVALVARSPRGSTLTPEGVVVAEWAARLLAVATELDAGLAAFRQDHQIRLRVSASLTIAEQLLPGWLGALQHRLLSLGVEYRAVEEPLKEDRGLLVGERADRERESVPLAAAPTRPPLDRLRTARGDDEQRYVAGPVRELVDEVEQLVVGPLQILEDEHDRPALGERLDEVAAIRVAERAEDAFSFRVAADGDCASENSWRQTVRFHTASR